MKRVPAQLRIDYAVVCDDVRIEASNKVIIIGVYGGSILLETFELPIRVSVWFFGVAPAPGEYPVELRLLILDERGKKAGQVIGKMNVRAGGDDLAVGFGGGPMGIKFKGAGKLVVQARQSAKARWKTITEQRVSLANAQRRAS